jgi:adenylate cyclase
MAADVVGYSRLMGGDEVGTLRALRTHRSELIDPTIASRRGRIVKTTGDGLLAEFPSAVESVACAITIQRGLASRNTSTAEEKRLTFRIGINIGDIIIEANDIFGDGVNVAARLEGLAEPGGICAAASFGTRCATRWPLPLRIWASSRSRTLPAQSGFIECAISSAPVRRAHHHQS